MKSPILNKHFFGFLILVFSLTTIVHGQTIALQILPFDKICAGTFNEFDATFNHSGFPVGTTFEVLLSDNTGSFTNPISTTTLSSTDITTSQKKITFAVPSTLMGSDIYKLRVKSSTGFISTNFFVKDAINIGGTLTYFPAYYKPFEASFFINNKQASASICTGASVTLSIDNPTPTIPNSSPVNYPSIQYKWYKDNIVIPGATTTSFTANAAGNYYVMLDYGTCTDSNFRSNSVTVTQSSGGTSASVISSLGNPFCSAGGATTLSLGSVTGNTYQWSKDNVKINGATAKTLITNQEGFYSVLVDFGGCSTTFTIDLKEFKTVSTINVPETNVIAEGETINVMATTNASNPKYEWYKNNTLISGITTNSYDVTSPGNYKVEITQQSGCAIVDEVLFAVNSVIDLNAVRIPNLISPNGDGINDTWVIPQEYSVGSNAKIEIRNSNGELVFASDNYLNNWPESPIEFKYINPIYYYFIKVQDGATKKGSITIVK
jgi:gliding motility-associated-like protein